ncbi:MAG: hypothetical protein KGL35_00980 [Bradyrhizobium sp.]|nr:hypothetical protein [Bradyrhizobium sp.]
MTYQFKVGDKGKTRDGRDYEVIAISPELDQPVIVVVRGSVGQHCADGRYWNLGSHCRDLLPPVQTRTVYVNVYWDHVGDAYSNPDDAREAADCRAIAVAVPVTFEFTLGQGIEP